MQELSESVLLSQSGVSRLVDRMEGAGLVERTSCDTDGRGTFAQLTADGRDVLRKAAPTHLRGIDQHFLSQLGPKEIAVLRKALQRVIAANSPEESAVGT